VVAPAGGAGDPTNPLLRRTYLLNWLTQLLGYFSNMLVTPVLPVFLAAQGRGEVFIGLALAAFSVTSTPVRPFMGRISDAGHLRGTLAGTSLLLGLAPFGYMIPSAPVLFVVRAVHGIGWAGLNVVGSAWAALLSPQQRRAQALGYFVLSQTLGVAIAPATGLWIADKYGATPAFVIAGLLGLGAAAAALGTRRSDQPPPAKASRGPLTSLIEVGALPAATLLFLTQLNQAPMSSYVPLYFDHLQIGHRELYFLATGIVSILGLIALRDWADRVGRLPAIGAGFALQVAGLLITALASDPLQIILGGMAYTTGFSVSQPSLYALAIDFSPPDRSGASMATYTMAFQLGGGFGAALWGLIIELTGYRAMYALTLVPAALALVFTPVIGHRKTLFHRTEGGS